MTDFKPDQAYLDHISQFLTDKRKDTFGSKNAEVKEIILEYFNKKKPVKIKSCQIGEPYSRDIREGKVFRIDLIFK